MAWDAVGDGHFQYRFSHNSPTHSTMVLQTSVRLADTIELDNMHPVVPPL